MRDGDRFWWTKLVVGLGFCVAAVLVPYYFLSLFPIDTPYYTSADVWQDLIMAGSLGLFCLGAGIGFALWAVPGRRNHRLRLAALRGDETAMPPADIRLDPTRAPDVSQQPIELMWRVSRSHKYVQGPLVLLQLVIAVDVVGVALFALLAPFFIPAQPAPDSFPPNQPQPLSVTESLFLIAGACALAGLTIVGAAVVWRVLPVLFGRPFGVIADSSGIEELTQLGSRRRIAWSEMRLLEVTSASAQGKRSFAIYAQGKRVGWTEYRIGLGAEYTPVGATASEMALRQEALLNLIAARTGLTPRTLSRRLKAGPAPSRGATRVANIVALLIGCLILLGLAAAEYIFPVVPFAWLSWASEGSLGVIAFVLLLASISTALRPGQASPYAAPPQAGAPSLESPGIAYELTWRTPLRRRVLLGLAGVALATNLVPPLALIATQLAQAISGGVLNLESSDGPGFIGSLTLAFFLAMAGILGVAFVYAAVMVARVRIRVDANGITEVTARRTQFLPWSSVQDVSWGRSRGAQAAYLIKTAVPTEQVSWPATSGAGSSTAPTDGAIPIGPDELAALVAAQIGKPIRVREQA